MKDLTTSMRALGLAFVFWTLGVAAPAGGDAQAGTSALQAEAEQIVRRVGGSWGVMAWSIDRQQPLFVVDANDPLVPASNNKVFTAIWALDVLGPDYRFPTDMLITGPIQNGVLRGDVVLRGSGDPAFGFPEFDRPPMDPLRTMARQLRARGVQVVEGGVIGDATVFDSVLVGPEWPRDTGGGASAYAPRVSGLPFQRNLIWVVAEPSPGGGLASIRLDPPVDVVPVVSTVTTGGNRAWAVRREHEDTVRVRGSISGRGPYRYGIGVVDPAIMAADALRQALLEEGIQVRGETRLGRTPENARVVHRRLSMPLGLMIPKLNQESDNFFAEHLWKAASAGAIGVGSFSRGGPASALHFMRRAGIPPGQLYQADGSGLSALNRASANALVRSLVYAHGTQWSELFHESMAVAADPRGTMRRMFVGTPAAGNLHAKTGYINNVRTLAGYVRAANGELIAFAFIYNGRNTSGARGVQQDLGVLLANYGRGAAVEADGGQ